jgi:hypothetical protein
MTGVDTARVASARRRVKRAAGQIREASADLTAALSGEGVDTVSVTTVRGEHDAQEVARLAKLAAARHGSVEVVILAHPNGSGHPPRPASAGEGDPHDRATEGEGAAPRRRDRPRD